MLPAATIEGKLVEASRGRSVGDQRIYLAGDELPPSSNVLTNVQTDPNGRFRFDQVPTGRQWQFGMRVAQTGIDLRTDPLSFDQPGVYRCRLSLETEKTDDGSVRLALRCIDITLESSNFYAEPTGINALDDKGFSQLHRAAMGGHLERVRELLAEGADVNVHQRKYHGTPLQYAASNGHVETLEVLLAHHADVDARDANGRTPLVWAAQGGHLLSVQALLKAGANIQAANDGGWTPLHYAVSRGHEEAAQLLIDRGASVSAKNSQGKTPVDLNPHLNLKVPWSSLRAPEPAGTSKGSESSSHSHRSPRADVPRESEIDLPQKDQHNPDDVVAEVGGKRILWRDIAPPPEWYEKRAEYQRKHGNTLG